MLPFVFSCLLVHLFECFENHFSGWRFDYHCFEFEIILEEVTVLLGSLFRICVLDWFELEVCRTSKPVSDEDVSNALAHNIANTG